MHCHLYLCVCEVKGQDGYTYSIVVTESSEEIDGRGDTILRAGDTFGVRESTKLYIPLT